MSTYRQPGSILPSSTRCATWWPYSLVKRIGFQSSFNPCVHAESLQLCPTLMTYALRPTRLSSVHGILQARILEWVVMLSSGDLPDPGIKHVSCLLNWQVGYLPVSHQGSPNSTHHMVCLQQVLKKCLLKSSFVKPVFS